jgi:hypothetical protein
MRPPANPSGEYYVDAVDANGCPASDTIDIWFKVRDVMADAMVAPTNQCVPEGSDYHRIAYRKYGYRYTFHHRFSVTSPIA